MRLVENVEVADENVEGARVKVRPFDKVIEDMIAKYLSMNRD